MADFSFQNKTVVFIINVCALAGAERQALGLAGFLKDKFNCKIHFIAVHSDKQTDEFKVFAEYCGINRIEHFGTPALVIRKGFSFSNLKKTIRAKLYLRKVTNKVKKMNPDVIIPYMNSASKLANLIYKDVGAKFTFWHELGESGNMHFDLLEKKAIEQTPFFCANAEDGFTVIMNKYGVKKSDCHLLTQYVSFKKVVHDNNKIREELNIPSDAFVYGMIAHYRDQKHPELLMEAFSKMHQNKNVYLIFLGNKNNNASTKLKYDTLVELSKKLNIKSKVSLLSEYSVEKILSIINVGILVSEFEGAPTVLMEYMLYGKPIIATDHVGCQLLMGDSNFLVPKRDVEKLTNKMNILFENEMIREEESQKNIQLVEKYSLDNYCLRLKELFERYS